MTKCLISKKNFFGHFVIRYWDLSRSSSEQRDRSRSSLNNAIWLE